MREDDIVQRAKTAFDSGHFHTALWWASEALIQNAQVREVKRVFKDAFPLVSMSLLAIVAENNKTVPSVTELMTRGNLTQDEAEAVAEAMISVYFAEELTNQIHPLNERYNSDNAFRTASNIAKNDLVSVKCMASALAEFPSGIEEPAETWRFPDRVKTATIEEMAFAIQVDRAALVIVLQAETGSDWVRTCGSLSALFREAAEHEGPDSKNIGDYQTRSERFMPAADDADIDDTLFLKYKSRFQTAFAKNAAHTKWLVNIIREPA